MAFNLAASLCLLLVVLAASSSSSSSSTSNIDEDRSECSSKLIVLAPCLPYVSGDSKIPTIDCCTGLKQVVLESMKCLCVLLKDKDDPNLGLQINGSLALALPNACHAPANITHCISLLHLPPNSTEAKIFKESHSSTAPDTKVPGSSSSSANDKSDGGMKKKSMIMEILLLGFFIFYRISI